MGAYHSERSATERAEVKGFGPILLKGRSASFTKSDVNYGGRYEKDERK